MKKFYRLLFTCSLLFIFNACANYKLNYHKAQADWQKDQPVGDQKMTHRIYLLGDAGGAPLEDSLVLFEHLKQKLAGETKNSSIIFLGDNVYPHGLAPKSHKDRKESEYRLDAQLNLLEGYKGNPFFVPGNHDWDRGLKHLRKQQKYVNKAINKMRGEDDEEDYEDYFEPEDGCPGPKFVEVSDKLVIVLIDSQWWLADWDKEPTIHDGCEIKNREMFQFAFNDQIKKYRTQNVVIAMHHPMYSYGSHGGKFSAKQHIFPLTHLQKDLYIPLPGLGSVYNLIRANTGHTQDLAHNQYKHLVSAIIPAVKKYGNYIFAAGHEHALQYIETDRQYFIGSGSGTKKKAVKLGKDALFAYANYGYSTLEFYEDGTTWVYFWALNKAGDDVVEVYRKKIKGRLEYGQKDVKFDFTEYESMPDTVNMHVIQNKLEKAGPLHRTILGAHFREEYRQTYDIPTLDLSTYRGGMTPLKRGGGNQTNSLRLEDSKGRQYAMRDMTKDASRLLPYPFNKMTLVKGIALDNFLASHPFSAFAIPPMAKAINIYHTNPELYYVPKQPALGVFNDAYGGSVYMIEERPGGEWEGDPLFDNADDLMGTPDVAEKLLKNHRHVIDQDWTVRTRLFDMVLGDWDRHDDQWRWARFEDEEDNRYYRPIPRDRDQAFSKYDGMLPGFARNTLPAIRQLNVYGPEVRNTKWANYSPRYFDRTFLNERQWKDWEKQIRMIQQNLTDEVIDKAFEWWPESINNENTAHIISTVKKRRDNLIKIAKDYYKFLYRSVDVVGTDDRDYFEVKRMADGKVEVSMFDMSDKGKVKERVYNRVFDPMITKAINLYGLSDRDEFQVSGESEESILVRLIGGLDEDKFVDKSSVTGMVKKQTQLYDDLSADIIEKGPETKDKRDNRRITNLYDRKAYEYEYNFLMPLPILGFNPDDGFIAGANLLWTTYKFKKTPYASTQRLTPTFAFGTRAPSVDYEGDFLNTFGSWDLLLQSTGKGPTFAFNYFGFGNDSKADFVNNDIEFYRVRQALFRLHPAIKKRYASGSGYFSIGPLFEISDIQRTENRFVSSDAAGIPDELFTAQNFFGGSANLQYSNLDNSMMPHRGLRFSNRITYLNDVQDNIYEFAKLQTRFDIFQNLDPDQSWILSSRFNFQHIFGDQFPFFYGANLGGRDMLQGYYFDRFYGKTSFAQNVDIRGKLLSTYNKALPFTFGIFATFDHGRVWVKDDTSDNWHYSYGGGIWIAPVDLIALNFGLQIPKENDEDGPRFVVTVGMGF